MTSPNREAILEALKKVQDPRSGQNLISADLIKGLVVKDGHVGFSIEVPPEQGPEAEPIRSAAEKAVYGLPGVLSVTAVLTAHRGEASTAEKQLSTRQNHTQHQTRPPGPASPPGVKSIIAVASGKGGVGKSTVAVNLALALSQSGLSVGLLDADIYGPSIPRMLGINRKPESTDGKKLKPIEKFGIHTMSIGFLIDEDTPMIWRGPMVGSALTQMLMDVAWGELDVLVVDMPPGTGDAQLTLAQKVPLAGAVIVSTPQEIALVDARKGVAMFEKTEVPILGLVENMSYFVSPGSTERSYIFGEGGVKRTAEEGHYTFLGEIPIYVDIRENSDNGTPIVAVDPDSDGAQCFFAVAEKVSQALLPGQKTAPKIVFE